MESIGGTTAYDVVKSVECQVGKEEDPFKRAADAVMLLRYAGMPARYAEGYYINGKAGNLTVEVTDADLTAWAEVYLDGIGFVPVWFEESSGDNTEIPVIKEPESPQMETCLPSQSETVAGADEGDCLKSPVWILAVAGILILAAILSALKPKNAPLNENEIDFDLISTNFSVYLCIALKNMIEYHGVQVDLTHPYAASPEIEAKLGKDERIRYERILYISDQLRFGKSGKEFKR